MSRHASISQVRTILAIVIARSVSTLLRVLRSPHTRRVAGSASLCVGLAVQMGLLFTAMYLIDLSVSLFELWADLARKHLELTL